jgi:hypothetical protein
MSGPEFEHKSIKPTWTYSRSPTFTTIPADRVMCMVDSDSQTCTLMLFNKHMTIKNSEYGPTGDTVEYELRLEVKIPITTMNALAMFYIDAARRVEGKLDQGTIIGPSGIRPKKEDK